MKGLQRAGYILLMLAVSLSAGATEAVVTTSLEMEGLLQEAERFLKKGSYHEAQNVLDRIVRESPGHVIRTGERGYRSPRAEAQQRLLQLPPEAFALYQALADAELANVLDDPDANRDLRRVHAVLKLYVLGTRGDEASLLLASLRLDRYQPAEARMLLERLLEKGEQLRVPVKDVLSRLFWCAHLQGDLEAAQRYLQLLAQEDSAYARLLQRERAGSPVQMTPQAEWTMAAGASSRTGLQPSLSGGGRPSSRGWQMKFELASLPFWKTLGYGSSASKEEREKALQDFRLQGRLFPTTQLRRDQGRLYLRSPRHIRCVDEGSGELLWEVAEHTYYAAEEGLTSIPPHNTSDAAERLFTDYIRQKMLLDEETLYVIVNNSVESFLNPTTQKRYPRNYKRNRLVALNPATGEKRWVRGGGTESADTMSPHLRRLELAGGAVRNYGSSGSFVSEPVVSGDDLFVVVRTIEGALVLLKMDKHTGTTLWQRVLCSIPVSNRRGRNPNRFTIPVGTALFEGNLFVNTGNGLLFKIDLQDLEILWATRSKVIPPETFKRVADRKKLALPRGPVENYVAVTGNSVIALSSDSKQLMIRDLSTGRLRLSYPHGGKARALIGVADGLVYVSGTDWIRAYDLRENKMVWEYAKRLQGAAALTEGSLLLPLGKGITALDPKTGAVQGHLPMPRAYQATYTGNLFTSKGLLFSLNHESVTALPGGTQ